MVIRSPLKIYIGPAGSSYPVRPKSQPHGCSPLELRHVLTRRQERLNCLRHEPASPPKTEGGGYPGGALYPTQASAQNGLSRLYRLSQQPNGRRLASVREGEFARASSI